MKKTLDDYQRLAALIAATKGIDSGSLQKLVFVLEALSAPFRYRYQMHFNEPYSEDLEADVNLLSTQGFVNQEEDPKTGRTIIRANPPAVSYLELADELKPYLPAVTDLISADPRILDFAATFGAWREFKYGASDALQQALRSSDRTMDAEGKQLLRRLGLLAGAYDV